MEVGRRPEAQLSAASIDALRRLALRYARTPDEADDIVQDMLLAALEQRRAWDSTGFHAWAGGVLRRRALFTARTEGRRRRREALYATDPALSGTAGRTLPRQFTDELPPSLRIVALLASVGLGRAEIANLLGIADTAMRQRISGLRRAWRGFGDAPEVVGMARAIVPLHVSRRRSLKAGLVRAPGARFAITDPDGHSVFFGSAHKSTASGNL